MRKPPRLPRRSLAVQSPGDTKLGETVLERGLCITLSHFWIVQTSNKFVRKKSTVESMKVGFNFKEIPAPVGDRILLAAWNFVYYFVVIVSLFGK